MNPETEAIGQLLTLCAGVSALFGLIVGSFVNVCILRMPQDRSIVTPASHCPSCGVTLRPYDLVPVLSWIILRGRCRNCQTQISSMYPTIELLSGLLAWLLFRQVIPSADQLDLAHGVAFVFYFGFVAMLLIATFVDLRHYIIPDQVSIYAVPYGIAGWALLERLGYPSAMSWKEACLGACVGGGSLVAITGLWWILRRYEGMGLGDAKLLAMIGSIVGLWPALPFVIIVAACLGVAVGLPLSIMSKRGLRYAVPFGPFLALSSLLWLFWGPQILARHFPAMDTVGSLFL